jgi:predicted ATPase/transcriptional regulator with XRE-family HTH domain
MEMNNDSSFGQWLKKRRKALDLTQKELAQRLGCAVITIQKIEADQRKPSKQMAGLLAVQLSIPPAEFPSFVKYARLGSYTQVRDGLSQVSRDIPWGFSSSHLNNLPEPPSILFGRDRDLISIRKRLLTDGVRLLTLLGPPGVGKTSLAIQAAHSLLSEYDDGVYYVSLASISDSSFAAAAIAQVFGVNETQLHPYAQRLKEYLRDKHLLLILDNFEQILSASTFVNGLLSECLWLSIIVTSRAPLRIRYERQYPVLPLEVPAGIQTGFDLGNLHRYPAIALFLERARAAKPDFTLTSENAGAIASICARLNGLPLAIEFVAAWIKVLSPQELLEQIEGQWMLHINGLSDASERHNNLYSAIHWSCMLLSPLAQVLFYRVGIFSSSWALEAVKSIMSDLAPQDSIAIVDAMSTLVNSSLVVQFEQNGGARFKLLKIIQFYALEQLGNRGEEKAVRQRHAEYYLALAEEGDRHLRAVEQIGWLSRFHAESENFTAALSWFFQYDPESGVRLAGRLGWYWNMCGMVSEGRLWLDKALNCEVSPAPAWRTKLLTAAGSLAWQQGDITAMSTFTNENIILCKESGKVDTWDQGMAFSALALAAFYQADQNLASSASEQCLALFKLAEDRWGVALALTLVGEVCLLLHDYSGACSHYSEALSIFRETGDRWAIGAVLQDWGYANFLQGDLHAARARLEESIALHHQVGERFSRAYSLNILAQIVHQQDQIQLAASLFNESLDLFKQMGIETRTADVMANLARVVQATGHYQLAVRLYNESLAMFSKQDDAEGIARCQVGLDEAYSEIAAKFAT